MTFVRTQRMTPTLSIRLRTSRTKGEGMLYCRLRFNGELTTEYKLFITVPIEHWPDLPDSHPQTAGINLQLAQTRADHNWLALNLPIPTANAIKDAWLEGRAKKGKSEPKSPTLVETYGEYVCYRTKPPTRKPLGWRPLSPKTIDRLLMSGKHLGDFLKAMKTPKITLAELRTSLGYNFADYLFDLGLGADTVSRHVYNVSDAVDHAARYDKVGVNALASVKIKGDPPKRIDYLNEMDLIKLAALPLTGIEDTVRNWSLLMCYTCLDHNDALKITKNLGKYYRVTPDGDTIVFQRLKYEHAPQWGECHIPVLAMTRQLLSEVLDWQRPRLKVINFHLKRIGAKLDFPFILHSKIFRKTGALVMLLYYENIYVVQKVMGHASVKVTEKYYVNMPPEIVYKAMARKPVQI